MEPTPNGTTPPADNQVQTPTEPSSVDTLPKESADSQALLNEVERERARAKTAQQEADRLRKEIRAFQQRGSLPANEGNNQEPAINTQPPVANPANEQVELERGIFKLILENPQYKDVLEGDKTLKTFFEKNPLSVTNDPINVDDAIYQIKRFFDDKVYENKLKNVPMESNDELKPNLVQPSSPTKLDGKIDQDAFNQLDDETQRKLLEQSVREVMTFKR